MLLEKLSNARGVSGNEAEVREILIDAVKDHVDEYRVDTLGNLIALKKAKGARPDAVEALKVMLAAHMDEVGLMIVHHDSNGHLRFEKVGGIDDRVLLSKTVLIGKDKIPGVIGVKPIHLLKQKEREQVMDVDSMTIDIGAKTKEEAQGLVKIGDYATFATEFAAIGDRLRQGQGARRSRGLRRARRNSETRLSIRRVRRLHCPGRSRRARRARCRVRDRADLRVRT